MSEMCINSFFFPFKLTFIIFLRLLMCLTARLNTFLGLQNFGGKGSFFKRVIINIKENA